MAKPKLKIEKDETEHDVIYEMHINHDSASGIYFAVVLMGDNSTYSKINGKKAKWWSRFAEGSSVEELLERISSSESFNGATDSKGKLLSGEDIVKMIDVEKMYTDAFYSVWCLSSNYENMEDREKADIMFTTYNVPKVLYSRAKNPEFVESFKNYLSNTFRVQKATTIMKFLLHTTRTDVKELKKLEVK